VGIHTDVGAAIRVECSVGECVCISDDQLQSEIHSGHRSQMVHRDRGECVGGRSGAGHGEMRVAGNHRTEEVRDQEKKQKSGIQSKKSSEESSSSG
jgi:hypothetical protein